jgi:NAD(P)-dependent dehydrogenase (short-subunit alcohol dehydrogenase family)
VQLAETVDLIRKAGGQVLAIPTDITDSKAVEKMVHTVQQEFGAVDILVNNAAVIGEVGPFWEADPDDWRHTLDVNLNGAFLCAVMVMKTMVTRQRGRIINVSSGAALAPIDYGSAYCISKAALLRLTEFMAVEGKAHGIIAFAIDPGNVITDMMKYLIESEAAQKWLPWAHEHYVTGGAFDPAEHSANLVVLLASGKVDSLSGRFIRISDDLDHMILKAEQIEQDDLYTLRLRKL